MAVAALTGDITQFTTEAQRLREALRSENDIVEYAGELLRGRKPGTPATPASENLPPGVVNEPYCEPLNLPDTGPDSPARLLRGVVPKGLLFRGRDSTLCGRPREPGIFRFTVQAGSGEEFTFRLVITAATTARGAAAEDGTLEVATTQLAVGHTGAEYVFQLQASGGSSPYSWTIANLPDDLEADTGSGVISGIPARDGEFEIVVAVQDAAGARANKTLVFTVRTTPIFITTHTLENGVVNEPYQARLAAQGGTPPYRWEIAEGELPEGLALNPETGAIDGVPTEIHVRAIRFRAVDAGENSDSADIPLEIRTDPLQITTLVPADGFVGKSYDFALATEGGFEPLSFSISSGDLPPGVRLEPSGRFTGVPSRRGDFIFLVGVMDSFGQSAFRSFVFHVTGDEEEDSGTDDETESPASDDDTENGDDNGETPELKPVTGLVAVPSDKKIGLAWKNPRARRFVRTALVRKTGGFPQNAQDGELIFSGKRTNTLDSGLENDTEYFYGAFAEYGDASFAEAAQARALARAVRIDSKPDPYADKVATFEPLDPRCFHCSEVSRVLGPPEGGGDGQGSLDVVSIGAKENKGGRGPHGGAIVLEFTDNIIVNGPGVDFTIFENAIRQAGTDTYFIEPATVEVSVDGKEYRRFHFDFVKHYNKDGTPNYRTFAAYPTGFAGVKSVYSNNLVPSPLNTTLSGGDQFDLSDIPGFDLTWVRFIRITSTGDSWRVDRNGELVRHDNLPPAFAASGKSNSGTDLDAVTAINY